MGIKPQKDGNTFMGEVDPSRHHIKILIWQLQKWLKNGARKCLYLMQLILHYILFGENFIG